VRADDIEEGIIGARVHRQRYRMGVNHVQLGAGLLGRLGGGAGGQLGLLGAVGCQQYLLREDAQMLLFLLPLLRRLGPLAYPLGGEVEHSTTLRRQA